MTEPTEPTPIPDPLAAMAETRPDSSILGNLTINDFVEQEKAIKFCCSGRGGDHSDCTPLKYLETTLELAKNYGLSVYTRLPTKKGQEPEPLIVRIVNRLTDRGCIYVHEVEVTDTKECLDYAWDKAVEIGVSLNGVIRSKSDLAQYLYENPKKQFWHEPEPGIWQCINESHVRRSLTKGGLSPYPSGCGLSDVEEKIHEIVQHCGFDLATPLGGYHSGLHLLNGNKVLVTRDFNLPEPAKEDGDFRHIDGFLKGLLFNPNRKTVDEQWDPYHHVLKYIQESRRALVAEQRSGGPALFIVGEHNAGKTLLIKLICEILGGRRADAHLFVSGETPFNDELIGSEVWMIDDGPPMADYAARKRFTSLIKAAVAADSVPCHCKNKAQKSLPLYRRMIIGLNSDDLEQLPVFSESMRDKYLLLRAHKFSMPKNCDPLPTPAGRPAFWAKLMQELPFFLRWLVAQNLEGYSDPRFGIKPYKDDELVRDNEEASGLETVYDLLCAALFDADTDAVQMKTADIWTALHGGSLLGGKKVNPFNSHITLGRTLSALSSSLNYKDLVRKSILDGYSMWTICRRPISEDQPHFSEVDKRRSSLRKVPPAQDDTSPSEDK